MKKRKRKLRQREKRINKFFRRNMLWKIRSLRSRKKLKGKMLKINFHLHNIFTNYQIIIILIIFNLNRSFIMTTQTSSSSANFAQPQSLVKYSNPVLVSTAGKKQNKVYSI